MAEWVAEASATEESITEKLLGESMHESISNGIPSEGTQLRALVAMACIAITVVAIPLILLGFLSNPLETAMDETANELRPGGADVAWAQPPAPEVPEDRDREGARPGAKGVAFGLRKSVRLDPAGPSVEADGYLNLHEGFVEFLACLPGTKGHETLVALQCDPLDLWLALVIGLQLDADKADAPDSKKDISAIQGDRILIFLRWQETDESGETRIVERRAEECLLNSLVEESMDSVGWVFTGGGWLDLPHEPHHGGAGRGSGKNDSKDWEPRSMLGPLLSGHLIAVSHRPFALLDHPLELPFPDGAYSANTENLPNFDPQEPVPVTLVFRRPQEGEVDLEITKMKVPDHPVDPAAVDPSKRRGPEPDDL